MRRVRIPMPRVHLLESRFLHFAAIGTGGFCVDETVLAVLHGFLGLGPFAARVISISCAMVFTWTGNRNYTFRQSRAVGMKGAAAEFLRFVGINSFGAVINYLIYASLVWLAPHPMNNVYLAAAAGGGVAALFNFTLSKRLVFRSGGVP